jgi:methyltransferase (TIGR00027 family)
MITDIQKAGRTALIISYWRARETEKPEPLFSDHLAHLFLDEAATRMAQQVTSLSPSTEALVQFRTRYFDQQITRQAAAGVKQVVLLGAGLDTRAIRSPLADLSFYELDQADLIEYKRKRLEESGYILNSRLVPCDYVNQDWLAALSARGFRADQPACIIWEGNSMYIPEPEIAALLHTMCRRLKEFSLSFDYLSGRLVERRSSLRRSRRLLNGFAALDAAWVTGFDEIAPVVNPAGLRLIEDRLLVDVGREYRPGTQMDRRLFSDYRVCTAVGGHP